MFISSSEYEKAVTSILKEKGELLAAVAFLGSGAESIFQPRSGRNIKLICNLKSGATNPSVIDALRKKKGVLLKQHNKLHAKVVAGSKRALVGSANFSSNGLSLEGAELSGWQEAGLLTRDPLLISAIREWFSSLWEESRPITDDELNEARLKWAQRRATRPKRTPSSRGFSLSSFDRSELLDRPVFVTISRGYISVEARTAYQKNKEKLIGQRLPKPAKTPPIYENWPELPKEAQLLDLYYGPRGALQCYGVFTRTHDVTFKYLNGSKGHLAVCRKDTEVMGYPFESKEASKLVKDLRPFIQRIWDSPSAVGDEDGKYVRLDDVLKICD